MFLSKKRIVLNKTQNLLKNRFRKRVQMEISKALKNARENIGVSQKDFVKDIISPAQYNRIEHGTQQIKLSTVIELLTANHVDVDSFVNQIESSYDRSRSRDKTQEYWQNIIMENFNKHDIEGVKKAAAQINRLHGNKILKLRAKLAVAALENRSDLLNEKTRQEIMKELFKSENWTKNKDAILLFSSSMLVLDFRQVSLMMGSLLKQYKNIEKESNIVQRRIASTCINFLYAAYLHKDEIEAKKIWKYLSTLPANPDLLTYKLMGRYYYYLFKNNKDKVNEIRNILNDCGYKEMMEGFPKI